MKFDWQGAHHMFDGPIRLKERIDAVGTGDTVAIERNPIMGASFDSSRGDRAVAIAPIADEAARHAAIDAIFRLSPND